MLAHRWTACVTVALAVAAGGSAAGPEAVHARLPQGQTTVRFHHVHYQVGDPSAAMAEAQRRVEGVRVIVQGLGVGVRAGREFLLFDRAGADEPAHAPVAAASLYAPAVERLKAWGLQADPPLAVYSRVVSAMGNLPVGHLAFVAGDFAEVVRRISAAGAARLAERDDSVLFDAGNDMRIEIVRDTDREETLWCPMHPDVRSADEGKCPICGMTLVPIPPAKVGEYKLDVAQTRDRQGAVTGLKLAVREPDTNAIATRLALVHERRLHLFIVSTDLGYFAHVHPDVQPDSTFVLRHPLPAGEYMVIADFLPEGGTSQMVQRAIVATGSAAGTPMPDQRAGLQVRMQVDGEPVAGKDAKLTFTVADATSGAPVTDLEPYLGAPAHMLIVRSDLGDAIHAHPDEQTASGPSLSFHPLMPAPGDYRLWIQFQRAGKVSTTAFDLKVR